MVQKIITPKSLKNIPDPPKVLYVLGNEKLLASDKIIAIVGTRQMTDYGKMITAKLTKELVNKDYIIVSGMALGVDGVAHQTAIENSGKTIAVLGAGPDIIYPPQHKELYQKILASGGAIVSEIPPGKTVPVHIFKARNRLISGLARGVLVTEGSIHSGSLITVKYALDQGKDVFVVPGPINSPTSEGTNYLLKQGAKPVTCVEDILEELTPT